MSSRQHNYWVYIMASVSRVIYVGVTNDLERRVWEHQNKAADGFTKKYNCTKLVWFGEFREIRDAIECEKRIKGWLRAKKVAMIEEKNPHWRDLSAGWHLDSQCCQTEQSKASQSLPVGPRKAEILRFAQNDNAWVSEGGNR